MTAPALSRPEPGFALVVEDAEAHRYLLEQALTRHGFQTLGVGTAQAALDALDQAVDVVLLDLGLPDMPGLDLLDRIRKRPQAPPVIVITASVDRDAPACLSRGAHDFMGKPPPLEELVARVKSAVRVKHLQDDLYNANRLLTQQAMTDALTGLANRRHGQGELERLVAAAQRHRRTLAILLADLDHFKLLNDTFGHEAGDVCLREAARRLAGAVRQSDLAVRWGGEEFVALLPDASPEHAADIAERIRATVAGPPFDAHAGPVQITLSVGWAMLLEGEDANGLVARADAALYAAKHQGRNRVVLASDAPIGADAPRL